MVEAIEQVEKIRRRLKRFAGKQLQFMSRGE